MFNLTALYTRWRFENNTIVEFNIHATKAKGRAPFNLTIFYTTKLKSRFTFEIFCESLFTSKLHSA